MISFNKTETECYIWLVAFFRNHVTAVGLLSTDACTSRNVCTAAMQLLNFEAEIRYSSQISYCEYLSFAAMKCLTQVHTVKHYSFPDLPDYVTSNQREN